MHAQNKWTGTYLVKGRVACAETRLGAINIIIENESGRWSFNPLDRPTSEQQ